MKKLVLLVVPLAALAVYLTVLKPKSGAEKQPKPKVEGTVQPLGKDFLVNLRDGRYARVSVALVLGHEKTQAEAEPASAGDPPEGYVGLHQEAIVRDVITGALAGTSARQLMDRARRHALEARIAEQVERKSDVPAERVIFTDVVVQ